MMETYQCGVNVMEKTPRTVLHVDQGNIPMTAEVNKERCESRKGQGKELVKAHNESSKFPEAFDSEWNEKNMVYTRDELPLFFKYGRRSHRSSGVVAKHVGKDQPEYRTELESFQENPDYQGRHTEEKMYKHGEIFPALDQTEKLLEREGCQTGEKSYSCLECGISFSQRLHLMAHLQIHAGEKPYRCLECGNCFIQRISLMRHQKIHAGVKPYKCTECGKSFIQSTHLKRHLRIHTGEKPYECAECGRNFSRKDKLLGHQRTHCCQKT